MTESPLKFCPQCGRETLDWDGLAKWSCHACGFVLFHNVAAAVAVILRHGEEILFTRRNLEPGKGKLDLPGGFTDPAESSEITCVREVFEELGLDLKAEKLSYLGSLPNVYPYKNILYNTLDLFYEYTLSEKRNIQLERAEITETVWISRQKVNLEDIAFASQRKFLKQYCEQ